MTFPTDTVEKDFADHIRAGLAASPYTAAPYSFTGANAVTVLEGPLRKTRTAAEAAAGLTNAPRARCVFVLETEGRTSIPYIDGGARTKEERPGLVIFVRSNPRDYDSGKLIADAVARFLDLNPPTGFFEAQLINARPAYLGENEQNEHLWSINVATKRHITTP